MKGNQLTIYIFLFILVFGGAFFIFNNSLFAATGSTIRATVKISVCGNDVKEGGEQCDRDDLSGQTCVGLGYAGGTLACRADCTFNTTGCTVPPPAPAPGVGWAPPAPIATRVVFQGKTYPLSSITILQDGKVATVTKADSQANFRVEISDVTAGIWTFGIWAEDKEGRKSLTFSFTTRVRAEMITTISGIFLPPTIDLDRTLLQRGETLNILGMTVPESDISIFINSPGQIVKKTQAEADGTWFYAFDTTPLPEGAHGVRAKAVSPEGLLSTFSQSLAFSVGREIPGIIKTTDINKDEKVNLVDFSILLYNWGIPKNLAADLNDDGRVNLRDFSIMMYWWTG